MNEDLYMLGRTFNNDVSNADLEGGSITSANIYRLSSQFVDKSSYIQAIDFNLAVLKDLIFLINAVNEERQDLVSDWFKRFRK